MPKLFENAALGAHLRTHLMGKGSYGGHELSTGDAATIITRIEMKAASTGIPLPLEPPSAQPTPVASAANALVRRGHWHSLELLENTRGVLDTLALYEAAIGIPSIYVRQPRDSP